MGRSKFKSIFCVVSVVAGSILFISEAHAMDVETSSEIIAKAQKEGTVTLYHSFPGERIKPITDNFTKRYKVKVEAVIGDVEHRLEIEQRAGRCPADLMLVGSRHVWSSHYVKKGWVAKYESPAYKNYPENAIIQGYAISLAPSVAIAIYNTNPIPKGTIKTYHDILNPKYKGKIAIADAHKSSMAYEGFFAKYWAPDIGPKWWKGVADLKPLILSGQGEIQNAVISGEAWISIDVALHRYVAASKKGAPVAAVLARGNVLRHNMCGVFTSAPHPNAARLLLDYLASVEAQRIIQEGYLITAHKGIPPSKELPELKIENTLVENLEDNAKHPATEMFAIYDELFKR